MKFAYRILGIAALGLGFAGLFLPLLPTVPFILLAAFCFARGNPAWEARLLSHPSFGPHIRAWRERGSISRRGKAAALVAFTLSGLLGLLLLEAPWTYVPVIVGLAGGAWIVSRPSG